MSDQPVARRRRGLVENAGGQLVCPLCKTNRAWPTGLVFDLPWLSGSLNSNGELTARGRRAPVEGLVYDLVFRCANGHDWSLGLRVMLADAAGAVVTTEWEEPPEDA